MSLQREASTPEPNNNWLKQHLAGLIGLALGLLAIGVAALLCFGGDDTVRIPDIRFTVPFLVATLGAGVVSLVRREGIYTLAISGVALAAAATVLGWAIVVGVIAAITAVIILIMQELM